jgi:hypothetical protein
LPRGGKRYFEISRVKAEIEFGLEHGVEQFHFVEANFNTLPHLDQIFETIQQTGANHRAHFYAEMRGEAIDEAEADRLQRAGFSTVEVGLQSAVPEVLARVKRKNNLPRLVRGVHLLREHGLEVFLDAILGLPGDSVNTFRQTLDFLEQHELFPYDLFHLQILAGTQLKAEALAGQYGLVWQDQPPYFVLQTDQLSFEDLCTLRHEGIERKGDDPTQIAGLPIPSVFALTNTPETEVLNELSLNIPIQRLVITLDQPQPSPNYTQLARRLASEVTVLVRMGEVTLAKLELVQSYLAQLSQPNPSGVWHLLIESERRLDQLEIKKLLASIQHRAGYLDRLAVFGLGNPEPASFVQWPSLTFWNIVPLEAALDNKTLPAFNHLIARVTLHNATSLAERQVAIKQVLAQTSADLLLEFGPDATLAQIQATLRGLDLEERGLWFREWHLAAGLASEQTESGSPSYPTTFEVGRFYQVASPKIDKAALSWTLGQRRLARELIT